MKPSKLHLDCPKAKLFMISLSKIFKTYELEDESLTVLKDVSVAIKEGEFVAILGPSGSGKSTLMHILGLLDQPTSGKIVINGVDISTLNDDEISQLRSEFVGFVFQQFNLINKLTILENILLPTIYARKKLDYDPKSSWNGAFKAFRNRQQSRFISK